MSSDTVQDRFVSLEDDIRAIDGVAGVVVLSGEDGLPEELQVFVHRDRPRAGIRERVESVLAAHGAAAGIPRVYVMHTAEDAPARAHVFEITQSSGPHPDPPGDGPRVALADVRLDSGGTTSDARVSLCRGDVDGAGRSSGSPTAHNLQVSATATVDALENLLGVGGRFRVRGAALVEAVERRIVCVVLSDTAREGELVGACPVGDGPVHEAAVRATLDALNRRLALTDGASGD